MNKFYILSSAALLFVSCGTRINYMGKSEIPTNKVDFFVDPTSITRNYKVIGKGYLNYVGLGPKPEKIQKKAILKGMKIGADAVLVQDFWTTDSGTSINTSYGLDSTRKKVITSRVSGENEFSITYLKYQ